MNKSLLPLMLFTTLLGCMKVDPCGNINAASSPMTSNFISQMPPVITEYQPKINLEPKKFNSCEELKDYLDGQHKRADQIEADVQAYYQRSYSSPSNTCGSVTSVSSPAYEYYPTLPAPATDTQTNTNVQEKGIDEADYVKIYQDSLIIVLHMGTLEVLNAKTLARLQKIEFGSDSNPKLFISNNNLLILSEFQSEMRQNLQLSTYKINPLSTIPLNKQVDNFYFGKFKEGRLFKDSLIIILEEPLSTSYKKTEFTSTTFKGIKCSEFLLPETDIFGGTITSIIKIPTNFQENSQSVSILGTMNDIYVSPNNIYTVKNATPHFNYYALGSQSYKNQSIIQKISLNTFEIQTGLVSGYIKDRWSLKEFTSDDGIEKLAIATTQGELISYSPENVAKNNLFIFTKTDSQHLTQIGKSIDFGSGENIRAVRYENNRAYVVTFKKTDPLFVFDISHENQPILLGELKVPGFSTYLHPIANNLLIGVGFDAEDMGSYALYQGVQVSLFDASNSENPTRLDVKVLGARGSSSEVTWNAKAFFYNEASKILAIPIVELSDQTNTDSYGQKVVFSGAVIYKVSTTLNETARITHSDWFESNCYQTGQWWESQVESIDINRIYMINGNLYSFSKFGVKVHDQTNPSKTINAFQFTNYTKVCSDYNYGWGKI